MALVLPQMCLRALRCSCEYFHDLIQFALLEKCFLSSAGDPRRFVLPPIVRVGWRACVGRGRAGAGLAATLADELPNVVLLAACAYAFLLSLSLLLLLLLLLLSLSFLPRSLTNAVLRGVAV